MKYLCFGNSKNFIVFLHGWGADKNSFLWLKDNFSDYSTIFVDFAGFGESPEPEEPYSLSDYVLELKKLLDGFTIDSLTIVGHSFGGRVAIKFAFLFQNEYEKLKLCLIDSAGLQPRRGIKYYFRFYRYKFYKKFLPSSKKLNNFGSDDYRKLSPVMKKTFIGIVNEDLAAAARVVKVKTLIIWGDKDRETKLYMGKKLHKLIAGSDFVVFKGCGHYSFLERQLDFLILLDRFLEKNYYS